MAGRFGNTLIVVPVESFESGQSYEENASLPLHLTLQPWFEAPNLAALDNSLLNKLRDLSPLQVRRGDLADFGKPVDLAHEIDLRDQGKMVKLHLDLGQWIVGLGGELNPSLDQQSFLPHVSRVGDRGMAAQLTIRSLQLVHRQADGRKLVGREYPFKGGQ